MAKYLSAETDAKLRNSFARQNLMVTFGAEITDIGPGAFTITAPILPLARQQHDVGHAGLTFALGDTAAGYAALSLMPESSEVMTTEMKINLLAPAKGDCLIAHGKVVKAGRRLSVVTAEVTAVTAKTRTLVAVLQGTMIAIEPKP